MQEALDYFIRRVRGDDFFQSSSDNRHHCEWHIVAYKRIREREGLDIALKFLRDQIRSRNIPVTKAVARVASPDDKKYQVELRPWCQNLKGIHFLDILRRKEWDKEILTSYDVLPNGLHIYNWEITFDKFITPQHFCALRDAAGEKDIAEILRSQWVWQNWDTFLNIFQADLENTFGITKKPDIW